jgi:hypothetical protein
VTRARGRTEGSNPSLTARNFRSSKFDIWFLFLLFLVIVLLLVIDKDCRKNLKFIRRQIYRAGWREVPRQHQTSEAA